MYRFDFCIYNESVILISTRKHSKNKFTNRVSNAFLNIVEQCSNAKINNREKSKNKNYFNKFHKIQIFIG